MTLSTYIRPLVIKDALVSYMWRNDPSIWIYTGRKATNFITPEIETTWLAAQLLNQNQDRFAICLKELNTYIGNVQLLDITKRDAELHLFIGNRLYWGKGAGYQATVLMVKHGFLVRKLEMIYLKVHPSNISALTVYEKAGFEITGRENDAIKMTIAKSRFFDLYK